MGFTTALPRGQEHSGIPEVPSGPKISPSPPFELSITPGMGVSRPGNVLPEYKAEAMHTIPEECERLFCDILSAIFLGERRLSRQELLGVDVSQGRLNKNMPVQKWFELLDYTSDTIHRGFVTNLSGEQTLFVFLAENALGHGLKTGYVRQNFPLEYIEGMALGILLTRYNSCFQRLIALFELANLSAFGCAQIVACVPRSHDGVELEAVRNLGWCGFNLTTLQPWSGGSGIECSLSTKWLFLDVEV
ncbi:hypothetical protein BO94DRAFT_295805 [Aspergillus sclerotioniger CBS 115572]|uniref:Uncharacterized protein n=1 Tax=Aspergillus sclerotioniger CBS 115572 TaxID=1450535 RepID=A0A317V576_9EURO|nr:hypothetical protein BO94DRAFT_295805 [Aspergillus sclerotioniger CBS 115572]PWY69166.1 hypothetical protein BO94DRAFT_295805 [Aspergillus sclerotioniger CBS 115572]